MRKLSKKTVGIILVIILCVSLIPMSAMATGNDTTPTTVEPNIGSTASTAPADPSGDITQPSPTQIPETAPSEAPVEPSIEPSAPLLEDAAGDPSGAPPLSNEPSIEAPTTIDIQPELTKVVNKPLVKVVYNYYDAAQNQAISNFTDYILESSHAYYAIAMTSDVGITIAANKHTDKTPVSTEALRFRVLMNEGGEAEQDITTQASYDAASGLVCLPAGFLGHEITVVWYCPTSEITELAVKATICTYNNGDYETITTDLNIASNVNSITIPIDVTNGLVVSQNGIDLGEDLYSAEGGNLNINVSPFGGDISVSAYDPTIRPRIKRLRQWGQTLRKSYIQGARIRFIMDITQVFTRQMATSRFA
jgi:hypothetical protein